MPLSAQKATHFRIEGTVKDASGAAVARAQVILSGKNVQAQRITDAQGHFAFEDVPVSQATLRVRAEGFAPAERAWQASTEGPASIQIALAPARRVERVTVTATRTEERVSDTAASTTVLTSQELSATAALTLDDSLRQVPGFVLFRRNGSLTANPTSQGVSLRGVGASGASRAAVLEDGVPLNDPFGGWVYWDRIPRESIEAVEVVEGGMSDLYGNSALGGVINIIPRREHESSLSLETSFGNERTPAASLAASLRRGRWLAELGGDALRTDGYIPVSEASRGAVDTAVASQHRVANLRLTRLISTQGRMFVRGSIFEESRKNGTLLQTNDTRLRQITIGADWESEAVGALQFRAYGGPQLFDQSFSSIAPDRNSEALVRLQRVPSQQVGGTAQWSRPVGTRQTWVVGLDESEVRGASNELVYTQGRVSSAVGAGGRQHNTGLFAEDLVRLTPTWMLTAAARYDRWHNEGGLSTTRPLAPPGPVRVSNFPDRTEQAFSPRLGIVHRLRENLMVRASAYRAFRAPTLNELYRSFRLGNVLTLANSTLRAERLTGGEGGASYTLLDRRVVLRGTLFWDEISQPIANVTLSVQPNLITRERENLGSTRQRGADMEAEVHVRETLTLSGGYQFVDSTVLRFPAAPALEGLLIPHVPRNEFTLQARYSRPRRITLGIQGRWVGKEFDDDQNLLPLNSYFALDAMISHPLAHAVEVFAAVENILDQRCDVSRTPVLTLGPPVLASVGVRANFK